MHIINKGIEIMRPVSVSIPAPDFVVGQTLAYDDRFEKDGVFGKYPEGFLANHSQSDLQEADHLLAFEVKIITKKGEIPLHGCDQLQKCHSKRTKPHNTTESPIIIDTKHNPVFVCEKTIDFSFQFSCQLRNHHAPAGSFFLINVFIKDAIQSRLICKINLQTRRMTEMAKTRATQKRKTIKSTPSQSNKKVKQNTTNNHQNNRKLSTLIQMQHNPSILMVPVIIRPLEQVDETLGDLMQNPSAIEWTDQLNWQQMDLVGETFDWTAFVNL
eukprot:TRINITY_DN14816_c0_g1_i1.p1 TRINITY_DN14816_c0_g1~~TRINITY_DN14816_c0_g1_i1.p1  ORF type:complete len:271 (+),score=49.03 TRINITY_DN14816_c0_g1_i1:33-845(+)